MGTTKNLTIIFGAHCISQKIEQTLFCTIWTGEDSLKVYQKTSPSVYMVYGWPLALSDKYLMVLTELYKMEHFILYNPIKNIS